MDDDQSSEKAQLPNGNEASRNNPTNDGTAQSGIWTKMRSLFSSERDASLRESLQGVIEQHESENGSDGFRPQERSMMLNLLAFSELRVDDVMVPRADIIAVDDTVTIQTLLSIFIEANHSRIPVYNETLDDPLGMVHIKDLVRWMTKSGKARRKVSGSGNGNGLANGQQSTAAALNLSAKKLDTTIKQSGLVREVLFVPPSMQAGDLLVKMQTTHIHMAIVVDEYGGTDGLASIEDLVEEIVGDIADEHDDAEEDFIKPLEGGTFIADARALIEDVEELLGVDLLPDDREEDADTLGGLVFSMLGRVPVRGELIRHPSGLEFEVVGADPRRVKRLKISPAGLVKRAARGRKEDETPGE